MMKTCLFPACSLLVALMAGVGSAADLPARKAAIAPPTPPPIWNGFYVGLNAGYGARTNSASAATVFAIDNWAAGNQSLSPGSFQSFGGLALANSGMIGAGGSGFVGGGQVGYNLSVGPHIVVGLEADMQGSTIGGGCRAAGIVQDFFYQFANVTDPSDTRLVSGAVSLSTSVDWIGTVRARMGYLILPTLLAYATGGLSYGGVSSSSTVLSVAQNIALLDNINPPAGGLYNSQIGFGGGSQSQVRAGWSVGGGVEWMFAPAWSVKAEGLYADLGSSTLTTVSFAPGQSDGGLVFPVAFPAYANLVSRSVQYQMAIGRLGLNYHF
jgi:outer membrane immunogenic protein